MAFEPRDEFHMRRCLSLAERGLGFTSPNPAVGAVVVKDGRMAGKGFHRRAGAEHAEIVALRQAGDRAEGATLYVSLEPCSHFGKTPPCADEIVRRKVARVVVAMRDPNPLVDGKGIERLRNAGVTVETGLLETRARRLNEVFVVNMLSRRPFTALKAAASLDGRIATASGESRWITGEEARAHAHRLRGRYDAVMVGINTVLKDDPLLTPRVPPYEGKKTMRVVVDSRARIPVDCALVKSARETPLVVAVTGQALPGKVKTLGAQGAAVLLVNEDRGRVDLDDLLAKLYTLSVCSVLVEGGGELLASFVERDLYDKLYLFQAPKLIGGSAALSFLGGRGVERLERAPRLSEVSSRRLGKDRLYEYYPAGSLFAGGA
ncbi:MAG: bifunctional diaminohydroxyphosphoribosylaminopyrimidine deaminase/5-amino-6-(5-phosphoribosylamino)uracil reductase RibD [Spirochaetales bacterium]|nr:bifunctional diaminohydroxyphosphoribosylaminopyrimidine deaminase/5-amino-6-(5-phosphoribosylamino)uracil reductase RibD [Spirochaetales bacterium]